MADVTAGALATAQDKDGFTPIMLACKRNDGQVLEQLLASKPRPKLTHRTREGMVATHFAASHTDAVCLAILLRASASATALDYAGNSPLMIACLNGSLNAAKQLISKGVDINTGESHAVAILDSMANLIITVARGMIDACGHPQLIFLVAKAESGVHKAAGRSQINRILSALLCTNSCSEFQAHNPLAREVV